jgi:hypothetical protein
MYAETGQQIFPTKNDITLTLTRIHANDKVPGP